MIKTTNKRLTASRKRMVQVTMKGPTNVENFSANRKQGTSSIPLATQLKALRYSARVMVDPKKDTE